MSSTLGRLAVPERSPATTERLVCGRPYASFELALVIKRTYEIRQDGSCVFAEDQVPLEEGFPRYDEVEAPRVSPPRWDSDLLAFKEATDVVVQGHAYAYPACAVVDAELRFGNVTRVVRVYGERHCEWYGGHLRLTPPEPFERMPLRYDRAYGGYDGFALRQEGDRAIEIFAPVEPRWRLGTSTRFHYPRNPAGVGYMMQATPEAVEGLVVPNLEFPFDPISPERLAVGSPRAWLSAPLPAGFDWYDPAWFPRLAYLGEKPGHDVPPGGVPEVARGWAPGDLLEQRSVVRLGWNPGFLQGASPGLAVHNLAPDAAFLLRNLFPDRPEQRVALPGGVPDVTIHVTASDWRPAEARLKSVVIRPDHRRVILVWSARSSVGRPYSAPELAEMKWQVA